MRLLAHRVFLGGFFRYGKGTQGNSKVPANFSALKAKHLKQFEAALAKISSLQVGQGAELIEELDSAVWSEEELQQIKLWISEKMDDNTGNVSSRPLQDFFELPRYLTLQWWNFLQTTESQLERVEQLTRLCGALGLRCPSERTVAVLVGLSCCIFRAQGLSDAQKYQFLQEYKPKIKKMLSGLPKPVQYLTTLPSDTTQWHCARMHFLQASCHRHRRVLIYKRLALLWSNIHYERRTR